MEQIAKTLGALRHGHELRQSFSSREQIATLWEQAEDAYRNSTGAWKELSMKCEEVPIIC